MSLIGQAWREYLALVEVNGSHPSKANGDACAKGWKKVVELLNAEASTEGDEK